MTALHTDSCDNPKAAIALDRNGHWRVNFTARTWRDLGRPIQQWLSTAAGISYGFRTVR